MEVMIFEIGMKLLRLLDILENKRNVDILHFAYNVCIHFFILDYVLLFGSFKSITAINLSFLFFTPLSKVSFSKSFLSVVRYASCVVDTLAFKQVSLVTSQVSFGGCQGLWSFDLYFLGFPRT